MNNNALAAMKMLVVVAAALIQDGRVLVAQRPPGKRLAGYWEFPGGKLEIGESPEQGLSRELMEELGIEIAPESLLPLTFASRAEPEAGFHLLMPLYHCSVWSGAPVGAEGQTLQWVDAAQLSKLEIEGSLPPADVPLIPAVRRLLLSA